MPPEVLHYAWLTLLFPFASFLLLLAMGRQAKRSAAALSVSTACASWVIALLVLVGRHADPSPGYTWNNWTWLKAGSFTLSFGFEVTNLSAFFLLLVTSLSLLVVIYSCGGMMEEERYPAFLGYQALLLFSMLGLVLSPNLLQFYLFWELLGFAGFLLVGFRGEAPGVGLAAKRLFLASKLGDGALLVAILLLYASMPEAEVDFLTLQNVFPESGEAFLPGGVVTAAALLLVVAAIAKAAQLPFHLWLVASDRTPLPAAALLHTAATTAGGVYLLARTYPILLHSPIALQGLALVGACTALFGAIQAALSKGVGRLLAHSTVSQLGLVLIALGLGSYAGYAAGLAHLFTHAFSKALVLLAAGVIVQLAGTDDLRRLGQSGFAAQHPLAARTFTLGALALAGLPPLSGFWSWGAIAAEGLRPHPGLAAAALLTAGLTAFGMARALRLAFPAPALREGDRAGVPADSAAIPLLALAACAVLGGALLLPGDATGFGRWITGSGGASPSASGLALALVAVFSAAGFASGLALYRRGSRASDRFARLQALAEAEFGFAALSRAAAAALSGLARAAAAFERAVVQRLFVLAERSVNGLARLLARPQNGRVQTYGLLTLAGLVVLLLMYVGRRGWHVG
ncbi:proton-conducting transporter membrane subunit [Gorillibacterium sp. CAU 1737]|uniref:NADH-quinone oxidoreductase subunit 5 family protein n=1 Tax=Gorillibacterium sp. CAU 1737 TaxID=3140362 RepID=UPI0032608851